LSYISSGGPLTGAIFRALIFEDGINIIQRSEVMDRISTSWHDVQGSSFGSSASAEYRIRMQNEEGRKRKLGCPGSEKLNETAEWKI
jgi:hypothetical protein